MTAAATSSSKPRQHFPYSTPAEVKAFWLKWGAHYYQTIRKDIYKDQEAALVKTLREEFDMSKVETVLDVGCGYGRIAKLILENFPNIQQYHGLDLSSEQLNNAVAYLSKAGVLMLGNRFRFSCFQRDFEEYYKDWVNDKTYYDLVVCVETMTIFPYDVQPWLDKLVSLSKKYVLTLDWYSPTPNPPAPISQINTWHSYDRLYGNNPSVLSFKMIPLERYTEYIFVCRVK